MDDTTKEYVRLMAEDVTSKMQQLLHSEIVEIKADLKSINSWKPELEAQVADLKSAVGKLQQQQQLPDPSTLASPGEHTPSSAPGGMVPRPPLAQSPSILGAAQVGASSGTIGHSGSTNIRGKALRSSTNPTPLPVTGQFSLP